MTQDIKKDTILHAIAKQLHNPTFKVVEFDHLKMQTVFKPLEFERVRR